MAAGHLPADDRAALDRIVARIRRHNAEERAGRSRAIAERRKAAWTVVRQMVEEFRRTDPGLRRIVLFGSLARDELKHEHFDIDLAIDTDRYLDLLGIAMKCVRQSNATGWSFTMPTTEQLNAHRRLPQR